MKRIVLTGASGHIGYHVAKQLLERGNSVILLIRNENDHIARLKLRGATTFIVDLHDEKSYQAIIKDADVLFHLASENTVDTSDEKRIVKNTFELTKKMIDCATANKVKTIIYTSSVVVLGRSPRSDRLIQENDKASCLESPYVKGKFLAEEYCNKVIREKPVDIRRLYPSWVMGDDDLKLTPPHKIVSKYLAKGNLFYFSGGISIAAVEEVARAHINAWLLGKPNERYIVAGHNISFKKFYSTLAKYYRNKAPFLYIPKWIIYACSVVSKILLGKKNPIDPRYVRSVIGNYSWYNSEKAIKELNYTIPPLDSILQAAMNGVRKKLWGIHPFDKKNNIDIQRIEYDQNDVLLITGFPGWLSNRMLDILLNGNKFGNYAVNRKIRLLVEPKFKGLLSTPENIEIFYSDITDKDTLKLALKNVKAVYHLAGAIYPKKINAYHKINYIGTKTLVDQCIECGVRRIIFMWTDSICGYGKLKKIFDETTPPNPYKNYGRSKYLAEKYILDKTAEGLIEGTSLRGFWFFGPFMPARNMNFLKMFYWKRQIVFGNGKNLRSISHIDNITQAFIKAEKNNKSIGKWYWIGNKHYDYTVDQIYQNIANGLGVDYKPFYIPNWACELFGLLDSILGLFGKVNATIHAAGKFHKNIAGDIKDAQNDFGYNPDVGFEEIKLELKDIVSKNYA